MNGYAYSPLIGPTFSNYRMTLRVGDHSAHHIRRIARSCLREWELKPLTETVELALTELITNVYDHVEDRRCTLLLQKQRTGVRAEVTDNSPHLPTLTLALDPESESGRGLLLLDRLVNKWGVSPAPAPGGGKTVWFECTDEQQAAAGSTVSLRQGSG